MVLGEINQISGKLLAMRHSRISDETSEVLKMVLRDNLVEIVHVMGSKGWIWLNSVVFGLTGSWQQYLYKDVVSLFNTSLGGAL